MIKFIRAFVTLLVFGAIIYSFVHFYPYIFSRKVVGVIENIERIQINVSLMQTNQVDQINPQLFSFAVAIKEKNGEIVTASAEDRQWAVAKQGQCAEAIYYPYPPWKLDKANTYYGARLEKLSDCSQ